MDMRACCTGAPLRGPWHPFPAARRLLCFTGVRTPLPSIAVLLTCLGIAGGDVSASVEPPLAAAAAAREPGSGGRFKPPVVFLDGEAIAVLRYQELPPSFAPQWKLLEDGRRVRRFSFNAWLRHVGIDPATIVDAHFHGGRDRVARIAGADLAKTDVIFSFSQSVKGKLRLEWPDGSTVSDSVDGVLAIALYRERPAPRWNAEEWQLELDGKPLEGPAYSTELAGGLRVYEDGRLSGVARRSLVGEEGQLLGALLGSMDVSLDGVLAVDLVIGDEGALRLPAISLQGVRVLGLPGSGGQLTIAGTDLRVSALLLHRVAAPRLRDASAPAL